jgi:hypothetical protein
MTEVDRLAAEYRKALAVHHDFVMRRQRIGVELDDAIRKTHAAENDVQTAMEALVRAARSETP